MRDLFIDLHKHKPKSILYQIIEKIQSYFRDYFNNNYDSRIRQFFNRSGKRLKVLDAPPLYRVMRGYTGVSATYIKQYVLSDEYSEDDIRRALKFMYNKKLLRTFVCSDIYKRIFEPYRRWCHRGNDKPAWVHWDRIFTKRKALSMGRFLTYPYTPNLRILCRVITF